MAKIETTKTLEGYTYKELRELFTRELNPAERRSELVGDEYREPLLPLLETLLIRHHRKETGDNDSNPLRELQDLQTLPPIEWASSTRSNLIKNKTNGKYLTEYHPNTVNGLQWTNNEIIILALVYLADQIIKGEFEADILELYSYYLRVSGYNSLTECFNCFIDDLNSQEATL